MVYAISAGASRQLTATTTALACAAPKLTSKYSMPFLSRKATRSWRATPAASRACPTWAARACSCAQVTSRPPQRKRQRVRHAGRMPADDVGKGRGAGTSSGPHSNLLEPWQSMQTRPV